MKLPAGVAAALLALVLAGCSSFAAPPAGSQLDTIGDVRVSLDLCTTGFGGMSGPPLVRAAQEPAPECTEPSGGSSTGQLLLGFLVPAGAEAPATLSAGSVEFTPDASYAEALAATTGTPDGRRWVGYISGVLERAEGPIALHVDADFGLPAGIDGAPYAGPFLADVVLGDRIADTSVESWYPAGRPVNCQEPATGEGPVSVIPTSCQQDAGSVEVATRDLVLRAGEAPAAVKPGETSKLTFTADQAGEAATFALSAATDLEGAKAESKVSEITGGGTVDVDVVVPEGAKAGTYTATLTAKVGEQLRTATRTFVVDEAPAPKAEAPAPAQPAAPAALPALAHSLHASRLSFRTLRERGVRATVGCNQACTTSVDLLVYDNRRSKSARRRAARAAAWKVTPTILVGRRYVSRDKAGASAERVKLFAEAAQLLRHVDRFTLVVRTTSWDARGGQRTSTVRKLRFTGVCAPRAKSCVRGTH